MNVGEKKYFCNSGVSGHSSGRNNYAEFYENQSRTFLHC
jgi:hypothetical protein